jgi:hypothetical protein
MSELTTLIAQTFETVRGLAALSGEIVNADARWLIAEIETQISRVEIEAARVKWRKAHLYQRAAQADRYAIPLQERPAHRIIPPKRDVRQTMRMVSEFYERVSLERSQMRKAA